MSDIYPFYKPDEDNIIFNPNVNKKEGFQAIKSCTLAKLIEKLTSTKQLHTYFSSAFFLTYRDFTTPLEIINLLVQRYTGPPPDSSKDHLRLFEIEVDIVQSNVLNLFRQLIGTLIHSDYENQKVSSSIIEFFNSLEENTKNELFLIYFKSKKLARPPGTIPKATNQQISSAASTMRFSFSVSPKTISPNSTNNVLTGLLSTASTITNGNNSNSSNGNSGNIPSASSSQSQQQLQQQINNLSSPNFDQQRSSIKMGKGIMKLLQSANGGAGLNGTYKESNTSPQSSPSSTMTSGSTSALMNQMNAISSENNPNGSSGEIPSTPPSSGAEKTAFFPEAIARELTIMEFELITALNVSDITSKNWNSSVNIQNLTTWFNRISSWVSTKIISKETPEERAIIIEAFINIASFAKDIKNYNCVMEILGSLHSSSISRLKNSWSLIPQKANEMFQVLNNLMSTDGNFRNYRKQLTTVAASEPCIPYLGLFLTDYTYLDESNPASVSNSKMINIDRILLISSRVQEFFQLFTNCSYNFQSNQGVREAILGEKVWDENEIFRLSKIREESANSPSQSKETNGIGNSNSTSSNSLLSSTSATVRKKNFVTKYRMSFTGNDPLPFISSSLTEREWKILTTNAKTLSFTRNKTILSIGETNTNLYRVISGRVKIESLRSYNDPDVDETSILAIKAKNRLSLNLPPIDEGYYIEEGEIFGQESFLYTDRPILNNIIVDSDECELMEIEKSFVLHLFTSEHILAATFYKHIATVMAERLKTIYTNFTSNAGNGNSGGSGGSTKDGPSSGGTLSASVSIGNLNSPSINKIDFRRRSTIVETPSSLDLLRDGNDNSVRTKFGLSQDEVIIKRYQCKHKNMNGTLYITKHNICFEGKFLGMNKNKTFAFDHTINILCDKNTLCVVYKNPSGNIEKNKKFVFKSQDDLSESIPIAHQIWSNHRGGPKLYAPSVAASSTPPKANTVGRAESFSNIKDLPSKEEWNQILKGTKPVIYKKGDILICEGVEYQKIFQIVKGECSVVKSLLPIFNTTPVTSTSTTNPLAYSTTSSANTSTGSLLNSLSNSNSSSTSNTNTSNTSPQSLVDPRNSVVISKLTGGGIFGEMSFLLPGGSATSLVVTSDEVEVYIIESYFLHIMLKSKHSLAPKFYKYLACVLESRVRNLL
ncbi:hypothetical protein DICPUDRAFT_168747 [Dictyostelium purpureum]|uniref:RasGEF domain-containing protein n=1 Tax=Dictyostelium purpureum TaxID=5786 RepID=F0ZPA6_DICPU|nr:uncharacterized protein DICPUDRAFT_168747 [Dictyostelium purpureum]EGC34233.1 hypothetical protein DICPUDRAFT_168747 [Dictyostelium purpureum]|eukprot:XP_003289243.1 hypothetical protein DICPUDRAFT_168747 [Dictyostelium purpureum]